VKNLKEKIKKIKFIIPIILGFLAVLVIYKFLPNRNLNEKIRVIFFYFVAIWLFYSWSRHWWKIARDEDYKKKREQWLSIPILHRGCTRVFFDQLIWTLALTLVGMVIFSILYFIYY